MIWVMMSLVEIAGVNANFFLFADIYVSGNQKYLNVGELK